MQILRRACGGIFLQEVGALSFDVIQYQHITVRMPFYVCVLPSQGHDLVLHRLNRLVTAVPTFLCQVAEKVIFRRRRKLIHY
jgi:hypothetical protein